MTTPIRVGAVLYDPKVSVIWDIIGQFFEARGVPIDVAFYEDYDRQVSAHLAGALDIAWNSPLAWLDAQRRSKDGFRAIAMRDTDRDRTSHVVVRRRDGIGRVDALRGRVVAMGAKDSPQATLIPIEHLRTNGLSAGRDYQVRRFDLLEGLHGDHIGGEREALRCLQQGEAAATCMLDLNWQTWTADGTIDASELAILSTTSAFDHCVFTVARAFSEERERAWLEALFSMSYGEPSHREMMDLEGLKAWLPGRTTGFELLSAAIANQRFFEPAR